MHEPSIAERIFRTFNAAKEEFYRNVNAIDRTHVLPWLYDYLDDINQVLGEDPFPYGLAINSKNVEKYLQHAFDQGLISRRLKLQELFLEIND